MTLDEAIKHAEEVAKEQRELFSLCPIPSDSCDPNKDCASLKNGKNRGCIKCAKEHEQLAEWLKDYKRMLKQEPTDDATLKDIFCMGCEYKEQEPKPGYCKDCKHFRKLPYHDTLGKCFQHTGFFPKGDWYCADYKLQESEDKE